MEVFKMVLPFIIIFILYTIIAIAGNMKSLNTIKSRTVGDGQHGNARFSTPKEIKSQFEMVSFNVDDWRKGVNRPTEQGIIVNSEFKAGKITAYVDTDDVHALMLGASGIGKTAYFLYPNIELNLASGVSMLVTDTKGDICRNYGAVARDCYGYNVNVIDLRNPTRSNGNNLLYLVNKYMDKYKVSKKLGDKSKAEKYAKIISKTIINDDGDSSKYGQNSYFYDSAEGLLTSMILVIAEFGEKEKRHIVSVYKTIQELVEVVETKEKGKESKTNEFKKLLELLPTEHKARWFAGASINAPQQQMMAVVSTVLSKLNAFLDSELEQILCFDTDLDTEKFSNEKSIMFVILPEEDVTKFFMVSLIVQQLYRELLVIADENGGKLKNKVMFLIDEFGTLPPIQSVEMMFSASRSRGISIVAIIQSFAQLEKHYDDEGCEIIVDNTQLTIFGGFAPKSKSAEELSKAMGTYTALTGSVTRGRENTKSLQMTERPLMTADEIKSIKKGNFIVLKTGFYPMKSKFKLFFKWGITFKNIFTMPERNERKIAYSSKDEIRQAMKYGQGAGRVRANAESLKSNAKAESSGVGIRGLKESDFSDEKELRID